MKTLNASTFSRLCQFGLILCSLFAPKQSNASVGIGHVCLFATAANGNFADSGAIKVLFTYDNSGSVIDSLYTGIVTNTDANPFRQVVLTLTEPHGRAPILYLRLSNYHPTKIQIGDDGAETSLSPNAALSRIIKKTQGAAFQCFDYTYAPKCTGIACSH